jgi:protein involved in sex pheromone biosynthesis
MNKLILILGSVLILSACGPSQEERNEESSKTTQKIEKTYQSFK